MFAVPFVLFVFSSCSFVQNTNTQSSDNVSFCAVAHIYDNADQIVKEAHDRFEFSKDVTVSGSTDVYRLKLRGDNPEGSSELVKQRGEELARKYIGDKYDENNVSISDDGKYCIYSYDDGRFSCNFDSVDSFQINDKYVTIPSDVSSFKAYDLKQSDLSEKLYIGGGQTTLKDVYDTNYDLWNNKFSSYAGGLEIEPRIAISYTSDEKKQCKVLSTYNYKGIPIDYMSSPFIKIDKNTIGNYNKTSCDTIMTEKDDVLFASSLLRYTFDDCERIEKMVSFEEAVRILDRELASGTYYEFSGCELIYTNIAKVDQSDKIWDHDYDYTEKWEFTPTWCFYIKNAPETVDAVNNTTSIRVDALTGEIRVVLDETEW